MHMYVYIYIYIYRERERDRYNAMILYAQGEVHSVAHLSEFLIQFLGIEADAPTLRHRIGILCDRSIKYNPTDICTYRNIM